MELFFSIFEAIRTSMTTIEIIASIFWILSVYFTVRQNIWCWPTGVVMVSLYIYIFFNAKLYSDTILQVIYFFMQFYGWYYWLYLWQRNKIDILKITTLSNTSRLQWGLVWIVWTCLVGFLMHQYTDAALPYLDATLAVASLIAQWFLSKKILENWMIWITVDIFSIGMYSYKELYVTAWLYAIFLVLATLGLIEWYNKRKKQ
jgi:nicotinamide mononucleotide transporter